MDGLVDGWMGDDRLPQLSSILALFQEVLVGNSVGLSRLLVKETGFLSLFSGLPCPLL